MSTESTPTWRARPIGRGAAATIVAGLLAFGAGACADDAPDTADVDVTTSAVTNDAVTNDAVTDDAADDSAIDDAATSDAVESDAVESDAVESDAVEIGLDNGELSDDELAGLLWMREEEQLAHDVYVALGDLWGIRIFENIAASETTHIDAALGLLDQFAITDPAADNAPGTFTNPQIQDLYDEFVDRGSVSMIDALEVGALIEELDISDLRARTAATDDADIIAVYARLEQGSRNHLRAFTSQLEARDVTYEPTVLDPEAFDAIVSSAMERGRDA